MALFDGNGSFGLGLGGFDISDFLGFTGNGGFGSMNYLDNNLGAGLNDFNSGQKDYLGSFDDDFTKFDSSKFDMLGTNQASGGLGGSLDKMFGSKDGSGYLSTLGDMGLKAYQLKIAKDKDKEDKRRYEDKKRNILKQQNDSLHGKQNLINAYYGNTTNDGSDNALLKTEDYV